MDMSEAYGEAAGEGYWDGVPFDQHADGGGPAQNRYGGQDPTDVRNAAGIILASLAGLWLLGGVVFRRVND